MKISVVIPAYNEEKIIADTLTEFTRFMTDSFEKFELIVVNDGSTDGTLAAIRRCSGVDIISYAQNRGKGYAVKRGVLRATGDYIFFVDADLAYSPENIIRAISLLQSSSISGVVGIRENRSRTYPLVRRIMSKGLNLLLRYTLMPDISDTQCGFKGFDRQTARLIFSRTEIFDFGFDFEVIYLSKIFGKTLAALPVSFEHRENSKVKPLVDSGRAVMDILKIRKRKVF